MRRRGPSLLPEFPTGPTGRQQPRRHGWVLRIGHRGDERARDAMNAGRRSQTMFCMQFWRIFDEVLLFHFFVMWAVVSERLLWSVRWFEDQSMG